jgi:hypothetical protein
VLQPGKQKIPLNWLTIPQYEFFLLTTVSPSFNTSVVSVLTINKERLLVICAETDWHVAQNKDEPNKDLINLSEYVMQAVLDYHGFRPYCIALATSGSLPRTLKDGRPILHATLCLQLLKEGHLPLIYLHTAIEPKRFQAVGVDPLGGIWGSGMRNYENTDTEPSTLFLD